MTWFNNILPSQVNTPHNPDLLNKMSLFSLSILMSSNSAGNISFSFSSIMEYLFPTLDGTLMSMFCAKLNCNQKKLIKIIMILIKLNLKSINNFLQFIICGLNTSFNCSLFNFRFHFLRILGYDAHINNKKGGKCILGYYKFLYFLQLYTISQRKLV